MKINDKLYDILKWVAIICLPALGTLYHALSGLWDLPYSAEIVGTISAVTTCLGIMLGISTAEYHKSQKEEDE